MLNLNRIDNVPINMRKILIIDDEPEIRELLKEVFERKGYEAAVASGGKEGIKLYNESPADVVIMDIMMPDKDGFETMRDIKSDFPDANIIAISGGSAINAEKYKELLEHYGVKYTFQKPVGYKKLIAAIEDLCGQ